MSEEQVNEDMESEKVQDDSYADVIFGKRRPDAMILDKPDKTIFVLEFKRTSDQRSDYRERGEARAEKQHKGPRAKPQESLGKGVWSRAVESETHHLCRRSVNTGAFNKERNWCLLVLVQ